MRIVLFILICLFSIASCDNANNKLEVENELDSNPIIKKWKLHIHQRKDEKNQEINLKEQPTEVILSIMDGGYFVLYDTFVNPKFNFKGFNRIQERSKGQWEFENKILTLHHHSDDTTYTEKLHVTVLNKNTLATKSKNKKVVIFKTYESY